MAKELESSEDKAPLKRQSSKGADEREADGGRSESSRSDLRQQAGNQSLQRLLAQRANEGGGFAVDEDTEERIESARGKGQSLDPEAAKELGNALGADFDSVRVHTSQESDQLNRRLNARAFTTGSDIFFRQGEYSPNTSGGKELLAHELTHVVQQGQGEIESSGEGMTVNEPGDAFEQEADAVAKEVARADSADPAAANTAQRQVEEEEEMLQAQPMEEEEELQMQEMEEEEEELQLKRSDEQRQAKA